MRVILSLLISIGSVALIASCDRSPSGGGGYSGHRPPPPGRASGSFADGSGRHDRDHDHDHDRDHRRHGVNGRYSESLYSAAETFDAIGGKNRGSRLATCREDDQCVLKNMERAVQAAYEQRVNRQAPSDACGSDVSCRLTRVRSMAAEIHRATTGRAYKQANCGNIECLANDLNEMGHSTNVALASNRDQRSAARNFRD